MQKFHKPAFVLLVLIIPVIIYLLSFSSVIHNKPFIEKQMEESGLFFNAKEVNSLVVDYLLSEDELINLDVFDKKEEQHLLDVKIVINRVFDFLFLLLALFLFLVYYNWKNKSDFNKIMIYSGMVTVAIPIILYFIPFQTFFTAFHNIFFIEGSWVFTHISALIQIYPFDFWYRTSFGLFLRGFVAGWALIGLGYLRSFF